MSRRIPQVEDSRLKPDSGEEGIAVGSPAWYAWLSREETLSFSYKGIAGNFTARQERRKRGGRYWVAYRTREGKTHKTYLGKSENLTPERLKAASLKLSGGGNPSLAEPLAELQTPILETKLRPPSIREPIVRRDKLIELVESNVQNRLTVVSAPPGFGKSTLLASWYRTIPEAGWLTLDPEDNRPSRFWAYFFAALDRLFPCVMETVSERMQQPHSLESVLTQVLNHITKAAKPQQRPHVLIIDDFHYIDDPTIRGGLEFMLDHLPPNLHLIVSGRMQPALSLVRLRASGHLREIPPDLFRFTAAEAADFLEAIMGLELTQEEFRLINLYAEGWITGLHLSALALQDRRDRRPVIQRFRPDNRLLVEYLVEEVLRRQPEPVQRFLLYTSVLEYLDAAACDFLLEGEAGHSQAMLEYLERSNLFVIPLDDRHQRYRYDCLFGDFLYKHLGQLDMETLRRLRRRAALWCEKQGEIQEAIRHALGGEDFELAGILIDRALPSALADPCEMTLLLEWLDSLPEDTLDGYPRLRAIYAKALLMLDQFDEAVSQLQALEAQPDAQAYQAEIEEIRAHIPRRVEDSIPASPDLLSPREREVLHLMAQGYTNQQIADELVIAVTTARTHIGNIYAKLGTRNRIRAIETARKLGLLT